MGWIPTDLLHSVETEHKKKYQNVEVYAIVYDEGADEERPKVLLWRFALRGRETKTLHYTSATLLSMRRLSDSDLENDADHQGNTVAEKNFTRFGSRTLGKIAIAKASEDAGFETLEAVGIRTDQARTTARAIVVLKVSDERKEASAQPSRYGSENGKWVWRRQDQVERMVVDEFDEPAEALKEYVTEGFQKILHAAEQMEGIEATGAGRAAQEIEDD